MLTRWVRELGFEVLIGAGGGEAWEHLKGGPCDLLITDLEMPDVNGLELIRRLRNDNDPARRDLPVIIVTSISDKRMREIAHAFGAATIVFKPLDKTTLLEVVQKIVSGAEVEKLYESTQSGGGGVTGISPSLRNIMDRSR